jgi:hypothetical protein
MGNWKEKERILEAIDEHYKEQTREAARTFWEKELEGEEERGEGGKRSSEPEKRGKKSRSKKQSSL